MSTAFHIRQNEINLVCKNQDVIYEGVYLMPHADLMRAIELLGIEVAPRVRDEISRWEDEVEAKQ
jgi:hypothetical protein